MCMQTEEEKRARAAACAGMQRLPEGIRSVPPPAWAETECQVCILPSSEDITLVSTCHSCTVM